MADPMLLIVGVLACSGSSIISSFFAPLMMSVNKEIPTDNDDSGDASTPPPPPPTSTPPPPSGWCTGNRKRGRAPHLRDHCKTITSQSDCLSSELTYTSQWDPYPYPHAQICEWNPNT